MDKIRETNLKKYGKEYVLGVPSIREKGCATKQERYGNPHYCNVEKANRTKIQRYGSTSYNNREKAKKTVQERYGVDNVWQIESVRQKNWHTVSKINMGFKELLDKNRINSQFEHKLDNYSYDFYLPRKNIVIEIDPTFTHKSTEDRYFGKNKIEALDKYYHYKKSITAFENDIYCIHIFDWDNKDKIIQMLLSYENIIVNQIDIITLKEAQTFIEKYSFKQFEYDNYSIYGYYYRQNLVQLVAFKENRITYMVHNSKLIVKDGFRRILDYYKQIMNYDKLTYVCDISKENIKAFEHIGFILKDIIEPQLHWSYKKKESYRQVNEKYKGVYDCGYYVLEYK